MIISTTAFGWLIGVALVLTIVAPVVLLVLLIGDWKREQLW